MQPASGSATPWAWRSPASTGTPKRPRICAPRPQVRRGALVRSPRSSPTTSAAAPPTCAPSTPTRGGCYAGAATPRLRAASNNDPSGIAGWLAAVDVRDEVGSPVRPTLHQFRHTLRHPADQQRRPAGDRPADPGPHPHPDDRPTASQRHHRAQPLGTRPQGHRHRRASGHPTGQPAGRRRLMKRRPGRAAGPAERGLRTAAAADLPARERLPHLPVFVATPEFLDAHREQLERTKLVLAGARRRDQLRLVG